MKIPDIVRIYGKVQIMKKSILAILICIFCFACSRNADNGDGGIAGSPGSVTPVQLSVPLNLRISVTGRLMTVSWNRVENARGYLVNTTSAGCSSGNRIINTADRTVTTPTGSPSGSTVSLSGITDRGNGFVTFTSPTSFTIWLMPEAGSETEVMASSITANIIALGNGIDYVNSSQSSDVVLRRAEYQ